jgi:hypothetical protein
MHSIDTVKTRQQAAPHIPKYSSMGRAYWTILREEGVVRGLYGGALPMLLGSSMSFIFPLLIFSTRANVILLKLRVFEKDSRQFRNAGLYGIHVGRSSRRFVCFGNLCSVRGWIVLCHADVKVVKVRLQLQGSYNNPAFFSGYNYKSTFHAIKTVQPSLEGS